jgi:hypothetical protein
MNCLFLDVDGVLNSKTWWMARSSNIVGMQNQRATHDMWSVEGHLHDIDPTAVGLLKHIVDETDCKIVISSTWRFFGRTPAWWVELFSRFGWNDAPVIGITPRTDNEVRGEEIDLWLNQTTENVDLVAIVDDDSDFLEGQPLVKTRFETGLTAVEATKIIKLLTPESE